MTNLEDIKVWASDMINLLYCEQRVIDARNGLTYQGEEVINGSAIHENIVKEKEELSLKHNTKIELDGSKKDEELIKNALEMSQQTGTHVLTTNFNIARELTIIPEENPIVIPDKNYATMMEYKNIIARPDEIRLYKHKIVIVEDKPIKNNKIYPSYKYQAYTACYIDFFLHPNDHKERHIVIRNRDTGIDVYKHKFNEIELKTTEKHINRIRILLARIDKPNIFYTDPKICTGQKHCEEHRFCSIYKKLITDSA
jgi:hypothetical protein